MIKCRLYDLQEIIQEDPDHVIQHLPKHQETFHLQKEVGENVRNQEMTNKWNRIVVELIVVSLYLVVTGHDLIRNTSSRIVVELAIVIHYLMVTGRDQINRLVLIELEQIHYLAVIDQDQ